MNDDQLPELTLRANAYVDGELEADDMARAEDDPVLISEIEQLRALRAELRDVEPPPDRVRESAIAAALHEFDLVRAITAPAATATTSATTSATTRMPARVVRFRPRPSYTRWLTAAAAVVAVGLLGVVIAQGLGGGGDEAGDAASEADSAQTIAPSAERTSSASIAADVAAAPEAAGGADVTAEASEPAPADVALAEVTAADTADATAAPLATATTPVGNGTTVPPAYSDLIIGDEGALAEVGQELLALFDRGALLTPETKCSFGGFEVLSLATYIDRDAIIAGDPSTRETGAFDPDTCEAFKIVGAPSP